MSRLSVSRGDISRPVSNMNTIRLRTLSSTSILGNWKAQLVLI